MGNMASVAAHNGLSLVERERKDGAVCREVKHVGLKQTDSQDLKDDLNVQIQVGERWCLKQSEECEWSS